MNTKRDSLTIIKPSSGWQVINLKELKEYRDLFYFLSKSYPGTKYSWKDIFPEVNFSLNSCFVQIS